MNFFKKIIKNWKEAWNESNKKDEELKHQIERESEQTKKDEEDTNFFKTNVANFPLRQNLSKEDSAAMAHKKMI